MYTSKSARALKTVTERYVAECEKFRRLDAEYGTSKDSPLHHDNRCRVVHTMGA